ncbi:MAG: coenzyme A pyrophosphatase [Moraxellaceae bacterium]|nr:MAG: coenzyme A pyrophosphatase [Moraxellaceae bacterium]
MLAPLIRKIRPKRIPFRHWTQRSAVAIISRKGPQGDEILLIERATIAGDPWSGHIAFPGGKQQTSDSSTRATAIRETHEEIGLDLMQNARFVGRSLDLLTRRHNALKPMIVTPYHFRLTAESNVELNMNHEVANVFWIPLAFLQDTNNHSWLHWSPFNDSSGQRFYSTWLHRSISLQLPCYYYQGSCIWGLTYQMLSDLLNAPEISPSTPSSR